MVWTTLCPPFFFFFFLLHSSPPLTVILSLSQSLSWSHSLHLTHCPTLSSFRFCSLFSPPPCASFPFLITAALYLCFAITVTSLSVSPSLSLSRSLFVALSQSSLYLSVLFSFCRALSLSQLCAAFLWLGGWLASFNLTHNFSDKFSLCLLKICPPSTVFFSFLVGSQVLLFGDD